jgi:hypothetical protein
MVALTDKFERLKKSGKTDPKGGTLLVGSKRFAGSCRYCGRKDHKAAECFKTKQEDGYKQSSSNYYIRNAVSMAATLW